MISTCRPVLLWVVLVSTAFATPACGDEYRSLVVGQCLPSSARVEGERQAAPPVVPCSGPHRYEVYRITAIEAGGGYPGVDQVDSLAQKLCFDDFESAVGVAPLDLPDDVKEVIVSPTESSWNGSRDREVECLLRFESDRTGSFMRR